MVLCGDSSGFCDLVLLNILSLKLRVINKCNPCCMCSEGYSTPCVCVCVCVCVCESLLCMCVCVCVSVCAVTMCKE